MFTLGQSILLNTGSSSLCLFMEFASIIIHSHSYIISFSHHHKNIVNTFNLKHPKMPPSF